MFGLLDQIMLARKGRARELMLQRKDDRIRRRHAQSKRDYKESGAKHPENTVKAALEFDAKIMALLEAAGPQTRLEIADALNMSRKRVDKCVNRLHLKRLIEIAGKDGASMKFGVTNEGGVCGS